MEEKKKVWIRGRKGCGKEIVKILEGLGATNTLEMACEDEDTIYFIDQKAAAQQQLTERNEGREPGIGKQSYYGFPNGVEAEDICRYLSFNLGNVVKYACRAGRKDAKKKIEDLMKARDYLDNEIKRLEEGDD